MQQWKANVKYKKEEMPPHELGSYHKEGITDFLSDLECR